MNMNVVEFKQYIYQKDLIVIILEKLKCGNIKREQGGKIITAALPNGNNPRSVQVKNNSFLDACIRSKNIDKIDLFDIVSYIYFGETDKKGMRYSREMAINWAKRALQIGYGDMPSESFEWAYEVTKRAKKNIVLDPSLMNKTFPYPHRDWINDGIKYETQIKFGVCYNLVENQIVFPIYNDMDELIGIKARNLNYKNRSDLPKYIYLNPFFVGGNLYGLNIAKKTRKKYIIIFEAEKSVMKAWQYGYDNTVALACKELTNIQVDLLNKYITDDTDIILAYDKDVYMKDGKLNKVELRKAANRFTKNNVYCLIDLDNKIGNKDAPIDCGKEIFENLLKNKKRIK